jgi:hypothetical protein
MRCTPADSATSAVREALVHAVADGAVVVERGEDLAHAVQHVLDADDVEEGLLLAGERRVGQVLGRGRRAHGERALTGLPASSLAKASRMAASSGAGKACSTTQADLGTGLGQRTHVIGVQRAAGWMR